MRELLAHTPDRFEEVLISDRLKDSELLGLVDRARVKSSRMKHDELTALVESEAHQGIVAKLRPRAGSPDLGPFLKSLPEEGPVLLLVLDDIQDPQNLGAILRSAECLGVSGVVWSWNRGVGVTPAVTKVSMGASELVPTVLVANVAEGLRKIKQAGFWVVATAVHGDAQALSNFDFPDRAAVVMGSEGEGVAPILLKEADFTVHIPMLGRLESLNVAQTTSIVLYEWGRRHGAAKPR